jgi:hypothetical protein
MVIVSQQAAFFRRISAGREFIGINKKVIPFQPRGCDAMPDFISTGQKIGYFCHESFREKFS